MRGFVRRSSRRSGRGIGGALMLAAFRVLVTGSAPRLFSARPRPVRTSASLRHTQQCRWVDWWRNSVSHATQQNPKGAARGPIHQLLALLYLIRGRRAYPHAPALGARRSRRPASGRYPYSSPWVSAAAFIPPGGGLSTCVNNRRRVLCLRHRRIVLAINMDPKIFASVRLVHLESRSRHIIFFGLTGDAARSPGGGRRAPRDPQDRDG